MSGSFSAFFMHKNLGSTMLFVLTEKFYLRPMKITEETVDHIAHLARLEFEGDRKVAIQSDLERIITFMDKLQEVNTENVEPLIFMSTEINRVREDVPADTVTQEQALKNAPQRDSDYFRIPKVLDK
jgi:aspartyl-tRNA(Asn)/glutamyl-tRNA(Gln) amidotransferase subunit C